jgi:uncharacterized protein (TIGR03000 family)
MIYGAPVESSYYEGGTVIQGGTTVQPGSSPMPAGTTDPIPAPTDSQKPPVPPSEGDSAAGNSSVLKVTLPEDALMYVNGRATRSTGSERSFVARRLKPGQVYTFELRAVVHGPDGERVRHEIVSVRGGQSRDIRFDFDAAASVATTVAVQVPADAKVTLAGVETDESGSTRIFSTDSLREGQSWKNYRVVATLERNGETVTREQTLDVVAGEVYQIKFDFDGTDTRVASR